MDVRAASVPFPIGGGTTSRRRRRRGSRFRAGQPGARLLRDPLCSRSDIVRAVNVALTPSAEQLDQFSELVPRLKEIERSGAACRHLNGRVYDLVALERLREELELGRRLGLVDGGR